MLVPGENTTAPCHSYFLLWLEAAVVEVKRGRGRVRVLRSKPFAKRERVKSSQGWRSTLSPNTLLLKPKR